MEPKRRIGGWMGALALVCGVVVTAGPAWADEAPEVVVEAVESDAVNDHRRGMEAYGALEDWVAAPSWSGYVAGDRLVIPELGAVTPEAFADRLRSPGAVRRVPGTTVFYGPNGPYVPPPAEGPAPTLNEDLTRDGDGSALPACLDVCNPSTDCAVRCVFAEGMDPEVQAELDRYEAELRARGEVPPARSAQTLVRTSCGGYGVCLPPEPPRRPSVDRGGEAGGEAECTAGTPESKWDFKVGRDDRVGDREFGAGYSLAATLKATTSAENRGKGDKMEAHAHALGYVNLFGGRAEIARVQGDASAVYAGEAKATVFLQVLGVDVFRESLKGKLAVDKKLTVPFFKATSVFTVVFVPVTVGVSIDGDLGIRLEGGPLPDGMKAVAKPYVKAYGSAWGGIGVPGLLLALECALTFLDVAAPLTTSVSIADACLKWDFDLSLVVQALSGRVGLRVQFLWINELVELFKWSGHRATLPLVNRGGVIHFR